MSLGTSDASIAGTISLEEAGLQPWDVVIAGAGPAGSLLARSLAAERARVLLVDKAAFPREKVCGSCLNGAALAALRVAGLADLPQRLGAVPLQNMRLRAGRYEAHLALPGGVSLSRRALDAALVRAAVESGAAFAPGTDATLEPPTSEFRAVRLRSGGREFKVKARIAVAADGLSGGFLKETPGMEPIVAPAAPLAPARSLRGATTFTSRARFIWHAPATDTSGPCGWKTAGSTWHRRWSKAGCGAWAGRSRRSARFCTRPASLACRPRRNFAARLC